MARRAVISLYTLDKRIPICFKFPMGEALPAPYRFDGDELSQTSVGTSYKSDFWRENLPHCLSSYSLVVTVTAFGFLHWYVGGQRFGVKSAQNNDIWKSEYKYCRVAQLSGQWHPGRNINSSGDWIARNHNRLLHVTSTLITGRATTVRHLFLCLVLLVCLQSESGSCKLKQHPDAVPSPNSWWWDTCWHKRSRRAGVLQVVIPSTSHLVQTRSFAH